MQNYKEEQLKEIEHLAGLCFTIRQIATILNVNADELAEEYSNTESDVRTHYNRGSLIAESQIRKSIFDLAKSGSAASQQQYLALMKQRDIDNIKNK